MPTLKYYLIYRWFSICSCVDLRLGIPKKAADRWGILMVFICWIKCRPPDATKSHNSGLKGGTMDVIRTAHQKQKRAYQDGKFSFLNFPTRPNFLWGFPTKWRAETPILKIKKKLCVFKFGSVISLSISLLYGWITTALKKRQWICNQQLNL